MDMLWCQGAQNSGLSNHKLKSALYMHRMITMQVHPSQTDRQTDRQTNEHYGNSATIRSNECIARFAYSVQICLLNTVI